MANVVARIRLANGEAGYYDDKSGIFLNWSHPEADVTDDMDLSGLRVSRRCRRIKVLSGDLGKPKSLKHILAEAKAKRLGVPVEHILHKGKKQAVYVEQAEAEKAAAPKATKKTVAKAKEEAKAEEAKVEAAAAEEVKEAEAAEAEAESEDAAEEAPADEKKAPAKKTTRRRKTTTKKAADTEAEPK